MTFIVIDLFGDSDIIKPENTKKAAKLDLEEVENDRLLRKMVVNIKGEIVEI